MSYKRTARTVMHDCSHVMALCLRGRAPAFDVIKRNDRGRAVACWLQTPPTRTDGPAVFRAPPI